MKLVQTIIERDTGDATIDRPRARRSDWWRRLLAGRAGATRFQPGACCGCTPPTCSAKICVTGCPSGSELVGATVTVKSGPTTLDTCTTVDDGAGHACCSILIGSGGDFEVIVAATGYKTFDGTKSLACGGTTTIALQPDTAPATVKFTVNGCCAALPGALITLSDGQGCTTDAAGQCSFWEGTSGTYTYAISKARFSTATGSVTISACQATTTSVTVQLSPAAGYACGPTGADPIPTTLFLTDSLYGSCTLTYDAINLVWFGTIVGASFAGGCGCPAAPFDIGYTLIPCPGISGAILYLGQSLCNYGTCGFGGSFNILQNDCPSNANIIPNPCAGKPFGTPAFDNCSTTPPPEFQRDTSWVYPGPNLTIAAGLPFDLTATIAPFACPGASLLFAYTAGTTITITE